MRLSKIKIAGFKSFVDPTTIDLRSNLTGIVGPNGCGKSNTIDAVRWVMGESSAKHLRGASMDDVIFNGSSSRKPIGQASIELLFDNSDATLGGEYAKFAEIGIKRQIHRDGQSKYFLNGTRCRRRDITDIFLGTGLGPRSYAIIEQGMISRLIEAKPEELRTTIEEAAGISKYKERRRETETRIRHTRENLDRLSDLREEMEKQLAHLKRQSKAAEKFKTFKESERRITAELILLRLQQVQQDILQRQDIINQHATTHQAKLAEQRSLENQIESQREAHSKANNTFNKVQADFYKTGSEISRLEQTIQHQKELEQRYQRDLEQIEVEIKAAHQHADEDQSQLEEAEKKLAESEPQLEAQQIALEKTSQQLSQAEEQLNNWQQAWNTLQERLAEPAQQAQVERARMEQLESQIQHISSRLSTLQADQGVFNTSAHKAELAEQQKNLRTIQEQHQQAKATLNDSKETLQQKNSDIRKTQNKVQEIHSRLQTLRGRLSSLEVLQKAGLGKDKSRDSKTMHQWLSNHQLGQAQRLAENIRVEGGWETALETVLDDLLEALQLESHQQLEELMQNAPDISASFILTNTELPKSVDKDSLAAKVISPDYLRPLLCSYTCVDTLDKALAMQSQLDSSTKLVTPEGILLGQNWLKKHGENKGSQRDGILARQKEIETTKAEIELLNEQATELEGKLETGREALKQLEEQQSQHQSQLNELHREESQAQALIHATENRIKQTETNKQRVLAEIAELELRYASEQEAHQQATKQRNSALSLLETLEADKQTLEGKDAPLKETVITLRQELQRLRDTTQQIQIQVESAKTAKMSAEQQLKRFEDQLQSLLKRKQTLIEQNANEKLVDQASLQNQLGEQLERRKRVEKELADARNQLQEIDNSVRNLEQQRHQAEQDVENYRNKLETLKLEYQEVSVREQTLKEQLDETDFNATQLEKEMEQIASLSSKQQELEKIQNRISRLGAINLAAIDEFKVQSERKVYLDQQNDDLIEALETLETAIAKIDRDTRSKFKDTFEKVNLRIQEMFPQLFGGGKAHLELTGDDLLTTGIAIMAQPPGKRISSIHLMSGGEKALTAVAMVFAIFELNPAPFCMLDEVDAPLDEANVGRFCNLVRKMSDRVQFIFITHNKTTMELADNLIGVTMREPGVSRLVSVDVNEAARMAQE